MIQPLLNDYWSARAQAYNAFHVDSSRAAAEHALWTEVFHRALTDLPRGATVVDMGCGTGFLTHILVDLGFRVIGVDASPGMLDQAREQSRHRATSGAPTARFIESDVTSLDPATREFLLGLRPQAIVCRWLLWTLREPVAALRGWSGLLGTTTATAGRIVAADGLWYPEGIDATMEVESKQGPDAFARTYNAAVTNQLPLSESVGVGDYEAAFTAAGLQPRIRELPETRELDARFGTAKGHVSATQFIISGTRGAATSAGV